MKKTTLLFVLLAGLVGLPFSSQALSETPDRQRTCPEKCPENPAGWRHDIFEDAEKVYLYVQLSPSIYREEPRDLPEPFHIENITQTAKQHLQCYVAPCAEDSKIEIIPHDWERKKKNDIIRKSGILTAYVYIHFLPETYEDQKKSEIIMYTNFYRANVNKMGIDTLLNGVPVKFLAEWENRKLRKEIESYFNSRFSVY